MFFKEKKYSERWFNNASDDVLEIERERLGREYATSGLTGKSDREVNELYMLLNLFDNIIGRRRNERYEREHPKQKVIHREHGRYLPNDD